MPNIIPVKNFDLPDLSLYTSVSEIQLLHYYEPQVGLMITESPNVIERAIKAGYKPLSFLCESKYLKEPLHPLFSYYSGTPVYTADLELLCKITGFPMTRGMLAILKRKELPSVSEICLNHSRIAVLENIVNPTNVGAIFRSAAAMNIEAILLTKGCSDPFYKRSSRVSMGSVFQIPWTYTEDDYFSILKNYDFTTIAMALTENSLNINEIKFPPTKKLAIFLGKESTGLSDSTISACDYTIKIPMANNVDSLNVAAASAVAFWELGKSIEH